MKHSTHKDVNEDSNNDGDSLVSEYIDINDDGVFTPSSINEEDLFVKARKKRIRSYVYDPRVDHATLKFKVMQRYKDDAECKLVVRKWVIINGYNIRWVKSDSKQLGSRC